MIRLYREIPPYVQTHKQARAVDESKSETVLVNAPHGDYVFSIITNNNAKTSDGHPTTEASMLIKKVSALIWHYYEPKSNWKPADGVAKFMLNE